MEIEDGAGRTEFVARNCPDPSRLAAVSALLEDRKNMGGWGGPGRGGPPRGVVAGAEVGPYRIREEIGRGGMGVVSRAEDPRLGRQVALKFLLGELTRSPAVLERF